MYTANTKLTMCRDTEVFAVGNHTLLGCVCVCVCAHACMCMYTVFVCLFTQIHTETSSFIT